ncbi:response regulator [Nitrospira moscoviensis]|uniref:Oxygen sensor histidine kinase NreB n=1 Tax=Nitrospira moscoviensis TaxID=42253 RepID=A0A0K2GE13_NITMO|nr:response regulator [Nitrospira moscoviensis]ALA59094.1 putative Histidine kinase [Nitrospira moscoviensis]
MNERNPYDPGAVTILNVDDDEAARYAKGRILRRAGYRVVDAAGGAEALRLAQEVRPQLVLLDVKLPDIDGLEVCRSLKGDQATASTMVLLISAFAVRREDKVSGLELGADGYLVEPVEPDELLATVKALVRLYRSEQQLQLTLNGMRKSEGQLRAILDRAPSAIVIKDRSGRILFMNEQCARVLGVERADVVGGMEGDLYPPAAAEPMRARDERVWETGRLQVAEEQLKQPDGLHTYLSQRFLLRDADERPYALCVIATDITPRRRMEDQLRSFAGQLEQLVDERTQELMQSQERLRALATELNVTEQRERKRLAAELHDHLAQMLVLGRLKLSQTKRIADVPPRCAGLIAQTEDVLDESLRYTRTLVADLSPPVLHDFGLPAAVKWLGEQMGRHGLAVAVSAPDGAWNRLPGDQEMLLFQSVRELLMNAAKHAQCRETTVSLAQRNGELCIQVQDRGVGFDPEALAADGPSMTVASKFGLFSIRERMRALGGSFHLDSGPGQGTTATLTLPLGGKEALSGKALGIELGNEVRHSGALRAVPQRSTLSDSKLHTARIRVLLVDDHAMVRQGLRSVLETYADVEIVGEAADGEEAVAGAERLAPDVVVMDINMPRMNGIQATARMRAEHPQTAVIGLSVNAEGENQEAMRRAGAHVLLTKEAAVDELHRAIQGVLAGK